MYGKEFQSLAGEPSSSISAHHREGGLAGSAEHDVGRGACLAKAPRLEQRTGALLTRKVAETTASLSVGRKAPYSSTASDIIGAKARA